MGGGGGGRGGGGGGAAVLEYAVEWKSGGLAVCSFLWSCDAKR